MTAIDMRQVRAWLSEASELAMRAFGLVSATQKPDRTWVTQADHDVETFLRARIHAAYPDHGIMGEEQGGQAMEQDYIWWIDPIDGTDIFVAGWGAWAISVGLTYRGEPVAGVIASPVLREILWTDNDGSVWRNDQPLKRALTQQVDDIARICGTFSINRLYRLDRIPAKIYTLGATVAHSAALVTGSACAILIEGAYMWDIAAALALLARVGIVIVFMDGTPFDHRPFLNGSRVDGPLLATTPELVAPLLAMLPPVQNDA